MVHTCNPRARGAEAGGLCEFKSSLGYTVSSRQGWNTYQNRGKINEGQRRERTNRENRNKMEQTLLTKHWPYAKHWALFSLSRIFPQAWPHISHLSTGQIHFRLLGRSRLSGETQGLHLQDHINRVWWHPSVVPALWRLKTAVSSKSTWTTEWDPISKEKKFVSSPVCLMPWVLK